MLPTLNFEEVGWAYHFGFVSLSIPPFVHPYITLLRPHIFGTLYAKILKFHVCIVYKKLAYAYFFLFFVVALSLFSDKSF